MFMRQNISPNLARTSARIPSPKFVAQTHHFPYKYLPRPSPPACSSKPARPPPETKPVLEVNAEHALVKKLEGSVHFNDLAHILFDQALLAEGGLPADPAAYVKRVNALLV